MSSAKGPLTGRLLSLDFLRGYFVLVIVIDHLWQFPSAWALVSGEAKLWVTAAEGFVMISGFLIGYVRGYKGLKLPFFTIAKKLFARAIMLYFWMIIVSMGYIWIEWQKKVPNMPYTKFEPEFTEHSYMDAFSRFIGGEPHAWIHFLYLYAILLVVSIGAVYLFRKRLSWLVGVLSLALYAVGIWQDSEWMKWQIIFFLPSIAGFHFDAIRAMWHTYRPEARSMLKRLVFLATGVTLLASILLTYLPQFFPSSLIGANTDIFAIEHFTPARIIVAILWFITLAFIFDKFTPQIQKYTHGTLEYVGTHSLTAYVSHGYVIVLVNFFLTASLPIYLQVAYNTFLGALTLVGVYVAIRLPILRRILPR